MGHSADLWKIDVPASRDSSKRCRSILFISLLSFGVITLMKYQSPIRLESFEQLSVSSRSSSTSDRVRSMINQLFDPLLSLNDIQSIWNEVIQIWHSILLQFLHDACHLCHQNNSDCYQSIDLARYVYQINESFYPFNETKRPIGMGLYYHFHFYTFHSLNNSILSTDVSSCDYFHMIQLMINVQLILHQLEIKYFLTKGTFIGTLRHHDIIPWDTDIDLFIPLSATRKILGAFRQLHLLSSEETRSNTVRSVTDRRSYQEDLVVYPFKNTYRVTSYKIFSLRSPIVNRTKYRWPKIDLFPYEENTTHIYAYPKHQHNFGTMDYIAKSNVEPMYLRLLGPLLVPSPYDLRTSLTAMVRLGRSNVFDACEGNTFLHRYNRKPIDAWRVPCKELHKTYPFVKARRNSSSSLCHEELIYSQANQSLSLYIYKCNEDLQRTL